MKREGSRSPPFFTNLKCRKDEERPLWPLYSRLIDLYTVFDGVNGVTQTDEKGQIGSWINTGQAQL